MDAEDFVKALQAAARSEDLLKTAAYLEKAAAALKSLRNSHRMWAFRLGQQEYWRDEVRMAALLAAAKRLPRWQLQIEDGRQPEFDLLLIRLQHGRDWIRHTLGENPPDGPTEDGFRFRGKVLDLPACQSRMLSYLWQNRRAKRDALYRAVHRRPRLRGGDGLPNMADRLKQSCRKKGLRITISFPRRSSEVVLDVANDISGDTHDTH